MTVRELIAQLEPHRDNINEIVVDLETHDGDGEPSLAAVYRERSFVVLKLTTEPLADLLD